MYGLFLSRTDFFLTIIMMAYIEIGVLYRLLDSGTLPSGKSSILNRFL